MNDQKVDNYSNPPTYPGPPAGGSALHNNPHAMHMNQQSPYMGQQPLPGAQFQQTTMGMGQPQMMPMQPHLTGQPSMMSMGTNMNANMNVGQQPIQPQSTGVMMNVMVPGMMPQAGPNYLMLCQQGQHARTRKYGACGIITAIIFFPIGLIALFMDVEEYCVRCGTRF